MTKECECVEYEGELYQCELCYLIEKNECSCFDGEININCRECF